MKCTGNDRQCTNRQFGAAGSWTQIRAMQCAEAEGLFSPYLDGAITGTQMLALQEHMGKCPRCAGEYELLRQTQQMLATVRRPKAPVDLGLKLRLAISREAAQSKQPAFVGIRMRLENMVNAFMLPATAGFLSAVMLFGTVMACFVAPPSVEANSGDVPLIMVNTAPELQQSAFGVTLSTIDAESLVIEAYVGPNGRVQDYRILAGPETSNEILPEVKRMLVFTTFRPATSMGVPTAGRAVLSFSKISVRG
jgi:Putative zinc-finger